MISLEFRCGDRTYWTDTRKAIAWMDPSSTNGASTPGVYDAEHHRRVPMAVWCRFDHALICQRPSVQSR